MSLRKTMLALTALSLAGWLVPAAVAAPGGGGSMPPPRPDMPRPSPSQPKDKPRETEFQKAEYLIKGDRCEEAIPILQNVVADNARDADAWNYLGYCHRKLGRNQEALGYYDRALKLNPRHRGAHEYLGELYLNMGDLAKAEQQLAVLKGLCPSGCEELDDLESDIEAFKARAQ